MRRFLSFGLGGFVALALFGCAGNKAAYLPPRLSDENCDIIGKVLSIHYPMTRAEVDKKLHPTSIEWEAMISGHRFERYWMGENANVALGFFVRNHPKRTDEDWVNPPAYTEIYFKIDGRWHLFQYTLQPSDPDRVAAHPVPVEKALH